MSIKKRMRTALALANDVLAERNLKAREIKYSGKHPYIIITSDDGLFIRKVYFSKTPSCSRWLLHLKKDIRSTADKIDAKFLKLNGVV